MGTRGCAGLAEALRWQGERAAACEGEGEGEGRASLTSLDLSKNRVGVRGARALVSATALRRLNLFGNRLGDGDDAPPAPSPAGGDAADTAAGAGAGSAAAVVSALARHPRLTTLDLGGNALSARTLLPLCSALRVAHDGPSLSACSHRFCL